MLSSTTARPSTEPSRTSPTPPPAASGVRSAWCIVARVCASMRRRCRIMCRALWIRGCQAAGLCEKGARRQGVPNDEPGCDSWNCGHEMCIPVICCHHPLAPAASTVGLRGQWLGLHISQNSRGPCTLASHSPPTVTMSPCAWVTTAQTWGPLGHLIPSSRACKCRSRRFGAGLDALGLAHAASSR